MSDETQKIGVARAGGCAIVGRPNVGKSTLLNRIVGQTISVATDKPGTTRMSILGVYHREQPPTQIAFFDTPGLQGAATSLKKLLNDEIQQGTEAADVVLMLTEASPYTNPDRVSVQQDDLFVIKRLKEIKKPVVLGINKVDLLSAREKILPWIVAYQQAFEFSEIVPVSALNGANVDVLLKVLAERLPEGVLYPEDFLTNKSERFIASEIIRKNAIERTYQEVPYGIACFIDSYKEDSDNAIISATLIVERANHKAILVGGGGGRIKNIRLRARKEIAAFLQKKVALELWVKVSADWTEDPRRARHYIEGSDAP